MEMMIEIINPTLNYTIYSLDCDSVEFLVSSGEYIRKILLQL